MPMPVGMAFQPVGGPGWGRSGCKRLFPARALGTSSFEGRGFWTLAGPRAGPRGVHERARVPGAQPPGVTPPAWRGAKEDPGGCAPRLRTGPRTKDYAGGGGCVCVLGVAHPQREPPKSIPSPSPAASGFPICRALAGQRGRGRAQPSRPAPLLTKAAARSARP